MRTSLYSVCLLIGSMIIVTSLQAQKSSADDSTGLPGDNFSLQGALQMFQNASSIEEFEKLINTQGNNVNNLDLNGDGEIDYIRVIDKMDKGNHAFVLQVSVSETENQDIAVIELEKTGDTTAVLQIIGDEDIYGEQTIVEPGEGDGTDDNSMQNGNGPNNNYYNYDNPAVLVNVWFWPSVRFVYTPAYTAWTSPWRWHRYPGWWHPWRPLTVRVFHPLCNRYHRGFAVVHTHRVLRAHAIYTPFRATSVFVRNRHGAAINHFRATRTVIRKGPGGRVRGGGRGRRG
ncbi:MAG: hypothetical protein ACHQEB_04815 [Chitinophagales bacterium]